MKKFTLFLIKVILKQLIRFVFKKLFNWHFFIFVDISISSIQMYLIIW